MRYLQESVDEAAKHCVEELRQNGGIGGVIALDNEGNGTPQFIAAYMRNTDDLCQSLRH